MKRHLLSLCLLSITSFGFSQTTTIPDPNFEQALIDLGHDDVLDGSVLTEKINTITTLVINEREVEDLTGIEDFVALVKLGLSYYKLTSINVSNNTALTSLFVNDNLLTTIDVSKNTALTHFGIMRNKFISIDVSTLVHLEELYLHQNELTSVVFPSNSPLWKLYIYGNQFSTLDLSLLTKLLEFRGYSNQLISLDISMLTDLYNFSAHENHLQNLNVANGNNSNFNYFNVIDNPDLRCVQVDNVAFSEANWTLLDSETTSFVHSAAECNALSVEELVAFKSYVFYNSSLETFTISSPLNITHVRLYSLSGQVLKTYGFNPEGIEASRLLAGVYIVQLDSNQGRETKKIVKY